MTANAEPGSDLQAGANRSGDHGDFTVCDRQSPHRANLEQAVRGGFSDHFGAQIAGFMPYLVRFRAGGSEAIIGFRPAADEALYLENYLDAPIEETVKRFRVGSLSRAAFVEVGQLVASDRSVIEPLFRALVPFLRQQGFKWICFTATHKVRALLAHAGLRGLMIAAAREDSLHTHEAWGSYYAYDPMVMVGSLDDPQGCWCEALQNHGRVLAAVGD